jgi:hypothetical protein
LTRTVYLVHGIGLPVPPLSIERRDRRDSLVAPPSALQYRSFKIDPQNTIVVGALGGVVVVQSVGKAATRKEALRFYEDEQFEPSYLRAVEVATEFVGETIEDFSFSFLWRDVQEREQLGWQFVEMPAHDQPLLIEATLIWCLADVVDRGIKQLPLVRASGQVHLGFVAQALDLFALEHPDQVWTSEREIGEVRALYEAWNLGDRIAQLRARFDQAASGFSFFWEAAERRRETTLTLALAVVAVIGLLQADTQLHRVSRVSITVIDWAILLVAVGVSILTLWRAAIHPRISHGRQSMAWGRLREQLVRPR